MLIDIDFFYFKFNYVLNFVLVYKKKRISHYLAILFLKGTSQEHN